MAEQLYVIWFSPKCEDIHLMQSLVGIFIPTDL